MSGATHDVVVVGAGPAGATTATLLARAGLTVALVDRARFPRDKTCGDGLTTLALRELDSLGLDPGRVASWTPVPVAHLHSPGGRHVKLPLPEGPGQYAAIARRIDLDAELVEMAASAGAEVREEWPLSDATQSTHGVSVSGPTGSEPIRARWIVAADGVWSPTRKALGLAEHRYRGEWHAFRQYRTTTAAAASELHVWFERDLLPGYVWSFPLPDGRANVGFGVLRGDSLDGGALARLWPEILARPHIAAVLGSDSEAEGPHRAWPIPARVDRALLGAGRVLFTGDAARATDVFTGEGIGQALLTGRLAAATITDDPDGDPLTLVDRYTSAVRHELVADHRMAAGLSRLVSTSPVAEASIAIVGLTSWTRRNVARWLFEDSPRGIALTPSRWRKGALSGPGAFTGETHTRNAASLP